MQDISMSLVVREALEEYLARHAGDGKIVLA